MIQELEFKEYAYKSDPTKILKELEEIGAETKEINIKVLKDEYGNNIFSYRLLFSHNKKITRLFNKYEHIFFIGLGE